MKFNNDSFVRTSSVKNVIDELLDMDLIPQSTIRSMKKNETSIGADPNLLMDLRHKPSELKRRERRNSTSLDVQSKKLSGLQKWKIEQNDFQRAEEEIKKLKCDLKKQYKKMNEDIERSQVARANNKLSRINRDQLEAMVNQWSQDEGIESNLSDENPELIEPLKLPIESLTEEGEENALVVSGTKMEIASKDLKLCLDPQNLTEEYQTSDVTESMKSIQFYEEKALDDTGTGSHVELTKTTATATSILIQVQSKTLTIIKSKDTQSTCTEGCFMVTANKRRLVRRTLLKLYWSKWRSITQLMKEERSQMIRASLRERKMEEFFYRLETQVKSIALPKPNETDGKKLNNARSMKVGPVLENRFKAQGKIIARQKTILEEQQKEIEKLKTETVKLQNEIGLKQCANTLRREMKTVSLENRSKLKAIETAFKIEEAKPLPELLRRMKDREEERKRRWEAMKEKQRQKEIQKEMEIQRLEEEKKLEIERKKKQEIKEKKAKILEAKLAEERRAQEIKETQMKIQDAVEHYHRYVLRHYFKHWELFNTATQIKLIQMSEYYKNKLVRSCFIGWRRFKSECEKRREARAEQFFETKLKRKYWARWQEFYMDQTAKCQVACDYYELILKTKVFNGLITLRNERKLIQYEQVERVRGCFNRILLRECIQNWSFLPQIMQEEREKEQRVNIWRRKVQEILPDFESISLGTEHFL